MNAARQDQDVIDSDGRDEEFQHAAPRECLFISWVVVRKTLRGPSMTDQYRIIDSPWPSDRNLLSNDGHDERGKALVATDQYSAIEFREETGQIWHQYRFAQNPYFYLMRHYLAYLSQSYEHLYPDTIKAQFLRSCGFCLRKLAAHRQSASILGIGGTIGENYWMLSELTRSIGIDLKLGFVGSRLM